MARADDRGRSAGAPWRASVVGLLLVGFTGACGPEAHEPPTVQGRALATYSDPSVFRVGPSELRRITDGLDPDSFQRVVLADGRVSRAELAHAWGNYAQCMRDEGFPVTTSVWDPVTNTTRIFTYARASTATTPAGTRAPTAGTMSPSEVERV